jgi:acetyl esterase
MSTQSTALPLPVDPDIQPFLDDPTLRPPRPAIEVESVEDATVELADRSIPIRVYRPTLEPSGTVVFFHGGGWMSGSLRSHDQLARKLAMETGLVIVSVAYRLAPQDPFPAGLEDCLDATRWVADHIERYGGIGDQLGVAGDSAGGNLAAVVARRFRDEGRPLSAQLLLYPVIDSAGDYPSRAENSHGYLITVDDIVISAQNYLAGRDHLLGCDDVAPMRAASFEGLAPAVIGVAHFDPMRDEGLAYGAALRRAGVDVFARDYDGMIHTFAALFAASPRADAALVELLREFRNRICGRSPDRATPPMTD